MKFEVVFYNDWNEFVVNQKVDSEIDANKWANELEFDYQDIAIDKDGNDFWKTIYRYYNPEDKELYNGFYINKIE